MEENASKCSKIESFGSEGNNCVSMGGWEF